MALDKLVDSTQLDSDLTSVANAIRTKGGTSAQLAFPADFVTAIGNIPSGYNTWATDAYNRIRFAFARNGTLPSTDIHLYFPNSVVGISNLLHNCTGATGGTDVTITAKKVVGDTTPATITNVITGFVSGATNIKTITFNTDNHPYAGSTFCYGNSVQRLLGTSIYCDNFGAEATSRRFNDTQLVEFYLYPNAVLTGGVGIVTGELIDASIVSVANALSGTATGQTLTISNAATKAKCNTIMGTVSQITVDGATADFFTQDANGTVSLADFITNTKGWTLA